ncbi:MAG TPA: acylneuraminate cytidylyltransferase family protein [Dissulfurispiraceae bacterium]|nr:acylneuraminate cytidylyltransferase family protein [Dissulfurispiraceae bacterium]
MNLCIIPARAGSKRIPGKNTRLFNGRPIIDYAIDCAVYADIFDVIMISTDSVRMADNYPDYVPFMRSSDNANDTAPLVAVVEEVLSEYRGMGRTFENVCVIFPTAVSVQAYDILAAKSKLIRGVDAVVSMCRHSHPIERSFVVRDGFAFMAHPAHRLTRTQDLPPTYYDAGQFYWITADAFHEQKTMFPRRTVPYVIEAVDIDNEEDWKRAEARFARN